MHCQSENGKKYGYFKSPNFSNKNEIEKNFVNNVLINRPF
tara:strand:- start:1185 stop:1304 length:120 start_codon:yes stop_codon:yes gene_type:complete